MGAGMPSALVPATAMWAQFTFFAAVGTTSGARTIHISRPAALASSLRYRFGILSVVEINQIGSPCGSAYSTLDSSRVPKSPFLSGFQRAFVGFIVGKSDLPDNDLAFTVQRLRCDLSGLSVFIEMRERRRNQAPYFTVSESPDVRSSMLTGRPIVDGCVASRNGLHVGLQKGFWKISLAITL